MPAYPKRLIEVDLPIRRISTHSRREKSTHHGHISTLHIWWARRPLAACRAVICAALWPDPVDVSETDVDLARKEGRALEQNACPPAFRAKAKQEMLAWTSFERQMLLSEESRVRFDVARKTPSRFDDSLELRGALLDFIADFANWDNSTNPQYLATAQALTQSAHEALGGQPGTRPLIVDPFAGGGSIPLEALRVGADAFASDLNPIPVLLNKVVLEFIPKYGQRLADEVRKWGDWIQSEAEKDLAKFYPKDQDGATPIAYLWARTITCEGPRCGVEIPLIRNMQITQGGREWHYKWLFPKEGKIEVQICEGEKSKSRPSVAGGSVTCPRHECGYTTAAQAVRNQLQRQNGGADNARLLAVYTQSLMGRRFRSPIEADRVAVRSAFDRRISNPLPLDEINEVRPYKNTRGLSAVTRIGITKFEYLYSARQLLTLRTFQEYLLKIPTEHLDPEFLRAVQAVLHCAASRFIFQNCSLSRWNAARSTIEGAFGKQALQVVWDFAESNPIGDGPANWRGALEWVLKVVQANQCLPRQATVSKARAQDQTLPDDMASALITDPPYFAAIPYADLSNVFYVWEREFYRKVFPDLFNEGLVNQQDEIIVTNANRSQEGAIKDGAFYKDEMVKALSAARNIVAPNGIGVVVFADSSTTSWEAILGAVIEAGWIVTGSWPIDTELQARTQADGAASLQSSVHVVCRPREKLHQTTQPYDIGDWRDVLAELPRRLHEWMPRLAAEGVVGADSIFACLGPALEIFSRYSRVEKTSGEVVTLKDYLEHVWAAVAKEALSMVFSGAETAGFEPDARITAMWLWTLAGGAPVKPPDGKEESDDDEEAEQAVPLKKTKPKGFVLEFDAARKIVQGLGATLEDLTSVVEVKGDTARLLPVSERASILFGKDAGQTRTQERKKKDKQLKLGLFEELVDEVQGEAAWKEKVEAKVGETTLDRVHQSMILFAAGRGEAMKRFLVDDRAGQDQRFWTLAQALSALYPSSSDEKRWVDGVLARKRGFGL
jgi:putative DNA methylase